MADGSQRFEQLQGYARALQGVGWLAVAAGVVFLIKGVAEFSGGQGQGAFLGAFGILSGIGAIVTGHLVNCVVAIEANTQESTRLLACLVESFSKDTGGESGTDWGESVASPVPMEPEVPAEAPRAVAVKEETWICSKCIGKNPVCMTECRLCGAPRPLS